MTVKFQLWTQFYRRAMMISGGWWVAAVGLLVYAIFSALAVNVEHFGESQLFQYYLYYDGGYVHRGLLGTLLHVFIGTPSPQWIRHFIPRAETALIIINIIFLWALLTPKILIALPSPKGAVMLAFTAVLLLSPLWGALMNRDGYLDEHIHFLILSAMLMLLVNRPLPFAIFCCLAVLVHRQGILFAVAIGLLAVHAAHWHPDFIRRRRLWMGVVAFLPLFFAVLLFANDNAVAYQALAEANIADINDKLDKLQTENFSVGFRKVMHVLSLAAVLPQYMLAGFAIYALPPLALAAALPILAAKLRMEFDGASPLIRKAGYLLPATLVAAPLPLLLVSHGFSRYLNFMWFFLGLATIYYVWMMTIPRRVLPTKSEKAARKNNSVVYSIAAGLSALAWLYGGMPLLVASAETPWAHFCRNYCLPGVTTHAAGNAVADSLWRLQFNSIFPISITAGRYPYVFAYPYLLATRNDNLLVPADYAHPVFKHRLALLRAGEIRVRIEHNASVANPMRLYIDEFGGDVPPRRGDSSFTEWTVPVRQAGVLTPKLFTAAADDFELISVHIDYN